MNTYSRNDCFPLRRNWSDQAWRTFQFFRVYFVLTKDDHRPFPKQLRLCTQYVEHTHTHRVWAGSNQAVWSTWHVYRRLRGVIHAFTYTHIHVHVHIRRVDGIVSIDFANRQQVKEYNKNMTKSGANPRILAERWHRCWKWHPDGRKWHFPGCWLSDFMCNSQYFFERRRSCYLLTFLTEFIFIWISKFNMWIIKTLQLVSRDVSQPSSRRLREYVCLWKSGFCTTQLRQKRWLSINDFLASQHSYLTCQFTHDERLHPWEETSWQLDIIFKKLISYK